ncbi:MAG: hypothetical protein K8S25_04045 [Alphaproteobacteria bacterium]|nr:hypothetical protein [Alphaproteobacteria bacterium]
MTLERAGALALIFGTIAMMGVMAVHPSGHVSSDPAIAAHMLMVNVIVHALAIANAPLLTFGIFALTRSIGLDRPLPALALAFYAFGAVAVMCAAIMSGLVATRLIEASREAGADTALLHGLSQLEWYLNQSFATVHVALFSVAIALLALSWPGKNLLSAILQISGLVVGIGVFAWLASGTLTLDVHGMGAVVLIQGVWSILAGFALLTRQTP